ncbi:CHAD domain-containing protein [Rhodopirellula sallentina]|uniref:CHAD domain containing protein n=1 Tax=Rhodopirellula sallentina SM41 TaxID=1263870 RepID=M5U428_9BACT|nr:CHAD domain-containing protein [Rhodopirellula sallentina]EMI56034.1 CHAD domain containing protein [Rhodopirellula sallentina SM41]
MSLLTKGPRDTILQLPAAFDRERLLGRLQVRNTIRAGECEESETEFCDTLDGDLWFAGWVLSRSNETMQLSRLDQLLVEKPEASCECAGPLPSFCWELPAPAMRETLQKVLKLRALRPLLTVNTDTQSIDIKNVDGKTVVRLKLQSVFSPVKQRQLSLELCSVQPLRGYDNEAQQMIEHLLSLGLYEADSRAVSRYLGELAEVAEVHPAKQSVVLEAERTSRETVSMLVRNFWSFARTREGGVIEDVDTEFLHEYRVALRRVRSLIAQSKGVYPAEITMQLKAVFGKFARITNRLRDLDVYLLAEDAYRRSLPVGLAGGLDQMFADFRDERTRECNRVAEWLRSDDYRGAVRDLDTLLKKADRSPASKHARTPIATLADKIVRNRHAKIVRQGTAVNSSTPDDNIHELRIEGKKLRYSLEFFGPLLDTVAVSMTIKRLKKLQDSLGDFNDICVQQVSLAEYLQEKQQADGASPELIASVGGLIGALYQRQLDQRSTVEEQIKMFCSADHFNEAVAVEPTQKRAA